MVLIEVRAQRDSNTFTHVPLKAVPCPKAKKNDAVSVELERLISHSLIIPDC
jgi:hypothetical protein